MYHKSLLYCHFLLPLFVLPNLMHMELNDVLQLLSFIDFLTGKHKCCHLGGLKLYFLRLENQLQQHNSYQYYKVLQICQFLKLLILLYLLQDQKLYHCAFHEAMSDKLQKKMQGIYCRLIFYHPIQLLIYKQIQYYHFEQQLFFKNLGKILVL